MEQDKRNDDQDRYDSSTPKKGTSYNLNNTLILEELESVCSSGSLFVEDTMSEIDRKSLDDHLNDSSFDISDFTQIDNIIHQTQSGITRKSLLSDSPSNKLSLRKKTKIDSQIIAAKSVTQVSAVENNVEEEEESQLILTSLTSVLIANANKSQLPPPIVDKPTPGRRGLIYDQPSIAEVVEDKENNLEINTSLNQSINIENTFYGLPIEVKQLLEDFKDIKELYNWQEECLNLPAIKDKKNLIYSLPTSGGKTLVAEILILKEILCHRKNVIFVLPYISIVQEKVRSLSPFALALGFLVEEYAGAKGSYPPRNRRWKQVVYVATIEKALGLINSLIENQRLHEIGLTVIDELHMIGEYGRGATLEILLTRLLKSKEQIQIIGMSATIGNTNELAKFLKAEIYTKDFRPVELREYVKVAQHFFHVAKGNNLEPFRSLPPVPPKSLDPDQVGLLVNEVVPESSCLVFCATKQNCENVAQLVCRHLQQFSKSINEYKLEEKKALFHALVIEGGGSVCSILRKTLPYGVAYHHSGLTMSERNLLEEGFRAGTLCCLCCTSTLAAGVNLPAKRVILRSPKVGRDIMILNQYKQMVGRAGRAGMDTAGESILICQREELKQVLNLLGAGMNECISQLFHNNEDNDTKDGPLEDLVLSSICLGQTQTKDEVYDLANSSLMSVQKERLNLDINSQVDNVISYLIQENVVSSRDNTEIDLNLKVNSLGRAAMKAHLSITRAQGLRSDLERAQGALNLSTPLHLLYVVTPPELSETIRFSPTAFSSAYKKLPEADQKTLKLVGISEVMVGKMLTGSIPTSIPISLLKRANAALILRSTWEGASIWEASHKFEIPRGDVQNLMGAAASYASNVQHFCKELPEKFWCFTALLEKMAERLSHCCSVELLPLMELPAVKKGRARQLYDAGYKTLNDIAAADPLVLVSSIKHLPLKVAKHIISTAHMLLLERAESLREDAEVLLEGVISNVLSVSQRSSPAHHSSPIPNKILPTPHASWTSPTTTRSASVLSTQSTLTSSPNL